MKRFVFLLILLPFIGTAQDLVRWGNPNYTPTLVASDITAGNMAASPSGTTLSNEDWAGFRCVATSNVYDASRYIQFTVTAGASKTINLSQFEFLYNPDNDAALAGKIRIRYSTTSDFSSGVGQLPDVTTVGGSTAQLVTLNFPVNTNVLSGQTMYIRMHLFGSSNPGWSELRIRNSVNPSYWTSHTGPALRGTVMATTLTAVNDSANVAPDTSTAINVIANDAPGPAPISSVVIASQPTNSAGTVSVNPDKTIQFVPANGFFGTSSFTYTIGNGISTSTATVNVTIAWPAPSGPLCGTYYVGSASQTAYPQFTTITAAVNHLNANGISCNVTFLLGNTAYTNATETFPIAINSYAGNTAYTTTFRPNTGTTVSITNNITDYSANTAVFKLNGADNVIIDGSNNGTATRNLELYNNHPNNPKKSVVWFASVSSTDGATNNVIKNLTLRQFYKDDDPSMGIYSGGQTLAEDATGPNTGNTISNVLFTKVGYAVMIKGSSSYASSGWKIQNNTIGGTTTSDKPFCGIYMSNATGYEISGNSIVGLYKNTTGYSPLNSGIMIANNSTGAIFNNVIRDVYNNQDNGTCSGIFIDSGNNLVYNNMISNIRESDTNNNDYSYTVKGHGIYMNSGANNKFYFNTIHMNASVTGGRSSCIYLAGGSAVTLKNNILYNSQSTGTQYTLFSALAASELTSDYNDFASGNASNIRVGSNAYTLTGWRSAATKDMNSIVVTPVFVSTADLHIDATNSGNLTNLDAKGTSVSGITTDIDSITRSGSAPDVGADEFGPKCAGTSTTWNGAAWSTGAPTSTKAAIINGNYNTAANGNINACELTVNSEKVLTIATGGYAKVENGITTAGSIVVEDNASLIQIDDTESLTSPGLNVTVKRISTVLKQYDYTYWSSPVAGATLSTVSSPSSYYEFDPLYGSTGDWMAVEAGAVMQPGAGYIAMAPGNLAWGSNPTVTATFSGKANSGRITKTIYKNGTSISNLIGNPYPSALDAKEFLLANQANITGNLYFWTHYTKITDPSGENSAQTYTTDDYAVFNLTGSTGTGIGNTNTSGNEVVSNRPNGQIASGQAFFVEAKNNNAALVFNNSMRTGGANTQFFRSGAAPESGSADKSRIWVSISNDQGAYAETLVGYIDGATNELDNLYDAAKMDGGNYISLYSILNQDNLVIQGRSLPFSDSDTVPLGYTSTISGTFTITLDAFDGIFESQDVYLFDKTTDTATKLNDAGYTFTSATGTFNDRFELRYTNSALGIKTPVADDNSVVVFRKANHIEVSSKMQDLQSVVIYDLPGRRLFAKDNINSTDFSTNELGVHSQVVIVKIKTVNNAEMTKKVIMD